MPGEFGGFAGCESCGVAESAGVLYHGGDDGDAADGGGGAAESAGHAGRSGQAGWSGAIPAHEIDEVVHTVGGLMHTPASVTGGNIQGQVQAANTLIKLADKLT